MEGSGITTSLVSVYPPKQIIGDYTKDSHQNISVFTWNDQRGGMSVNRMNLDQGDRSAFTQLDISHQGHITFYGADAFLTGNTSGIPLINQLGTLLVSANGTDVQSYSDGWTSRNTLAAAPTDVKNGNLAGTEFLVYAIGTGYEYSSAIATWASSAKDALNLEFWHDRFWGIDATGQLWYTYTMGSAEVNDARVLLQSGEVITGLFQGRSPTQEFILYAVTSKRLLAHDIGNRRFLPIEDIVLADNNAFTHERPAVVWRQRIYLANGRGIIEYDPVTGTIRDIGFDLDDGLAVTFDGVISCMVAAPRELFVGTKPSSSSDFAVIMKWDGRGWGIFNTDPNVTDPVESLHVASGIDGTGSETLPNLFEGRATAIQHFNINNSSTRTANIDGWTYTTVNTRDQHDYPVFDAGQADVTKVLLRVKFDVQGVNASPGSHVTVFVAFDGGSFTQLTDTHTSDSTFSAANDNIEGEGTTTFHFPSVAAPSGTAFRNLQVRFVLDNPTPTNASPDVLSVTLEYIKVLDAKLAFDFDLDLNAPYSDLSPQAARALLVTALETAILVELTFREDDTSGNPRNYFVNVKQISAIEETGNQETGRVHIRAEEA